MTAILSKVRAKLPANSLRARFAGGAFWSLVGTVMQRGSNLAAGVFIARLIGKDQFGQLGLVLTTVTMFTAYASLRLGLMAARHVAELRNKDPQRAGTILGLSWAMASVSGLVVTGLAIALAPFLARTVMNAPELSGLLQIGAVMLLFEALNGAQQGALTGLEAFRAIAIGNTVRGVLALPVMVLLAWYFGLTGAVIAYAAMSATGWTIMHVAMRIETRRAGIRMHFSRLRSEVHLIWRFAIPAFLGGMLLAPTVWAACAILANQPDGWAELGLFNAARQWWALLLFLPQILAQVVVPLMTERFAASDHRSMRKVLFATAGLNALFTVPMAIVASLLSPFIMSMYGEGFSVGAWTLVLMVWAAALVGIQQPVAQVIVAANRMWFSFMLNLVWSLVLLGSFLLLRGEGSVGLGISFVISYVVQMGLSAATAMRLTRPSAAVAPQPAPGPSDEPSSPAAEPGGATQAGGPVSES